jgi:tripartite-type tricarboxylate transporter receptor subunit TctC
VAASPTLITRLSREIGAVLDDPELRAAFAKNGIEAQASTPAELSARMSADAKKWRDVIVSAGITAN